ncbi:hypothetical protein [Paraburkholderia sp. J8-2]|uniref:hypothetical protein n=1 Tax=Paraburkholderia sp. J8-2 TaxID=2805440 RepID=UPI002AB66D31|nr:hypothetical protein [Paraburkholderia sp. J8-2]
MKEKLVKVDVAFLFQLAGMKAGESVEPALFHKAFDVYRAAYKRILTEYRDRPSARNPDGSRAYRTEAFSALADPRDGAKVFAVWFTSDRAFSRPMLIDLLCLCSMRMVDAAVEAGIACLFLGAREVKTYETVETSELF